MATRKPRFYVSFGYKTQTNLKWGELEPKIMTYDDIAMFIKMLEPFRCEHYIEQLGFLIRGEKMFIRSVANEEAIGLYAKVIKIKRV